MRCRQSRKRHGSQQLVGVRCNWCRDGGSCGEGHIRIQWHRGVSFPVQPVKMKFTSDMTQVSQTLSVRGPDKTGVPVVSSDGAWDTEAATIGN